MSDTDLIDASIHRGVAAGSCVLIEDCEMVYAGPLANAPGIEGRLILLNPDDFARLRGDFGANGGLLS